MTITLYTVSDDPRVLNKTLGSAITTAKTLSIYDSIDIVSPVFVLDYNANIVNATYLYCEELHRYYFINGISLDKGTRMILSCSIDVLMTYKNQLVNCKCCVLRNEHGLGETIDEKLPIAPNRVAIEGVVLTSTKLTNPTPSIVLGVLS